MAVSAYVHRVRDSVTLSFIGVDGETLYLTADDARRLAGLLENCAADVREYPFTNSQFLSASFDLTNKRATIANARKPAKE